METLIKTKKLTIEQYTKAVKLGYYEPIMCLSVFRKLVTFYKVCGRTEKLIIDLK